MSDHSKTQAAMAGAKARGTRIKEIRATPTAEDLSGLPVKEYRKDLSPHDLKVVKNAVKTGMSGGFRQVYMWFGEGAKEHWADSIALGVVTSREGLVDTDWVHQVRLAVYKEIGLDPADLATPFRMPDLSRKSQ